jgi:beta-mannosidase
VTVGGGLPSRAVSSVTSRALEGWTLASTEPGEALGPQDLEGLTPDWRAATVPGTVASSVGPAELDEHENYDAFDWWYRCEFDGPGESSASNIGHRLRCDGLATLAEVWLNGERILEASNMFTAYEVDITPLLRARNHLAIVFRSLDAALAERRPRPRWKTRLVPHQQLRWFRTTLLGRMPGWTPSIRPVGPWRGIYLDSAEDFRVVSWDLRTTLVGKDGTVSLKGSLGGRSDEWGLTSAVLRVEGAAFPLTLSRTDSGWDIEGTATLSNPDLWWPRTHGEPTLHECRVEVDTSEGPAWIDCGRVGFRSVDVDVTDGRVQFIVNGVPVFCRGACWTTNDVVSLGGDGEAMRRTLELAAGANANMIRVGGTMTYEADAFYDACDELGLMVWQDFMFANMDYPVEDPTFSSSIRTEVTQQIARLSRHASVVCYCGGSEVEQQAAMFGAPRDVWRNDFFAQDLPEILEELAPGTQYWPSSPTGGALPFHLGEGLAHYYGVGAYRRALDDARLAPVKFAPECLGFSNVPEPANLRTMAAEGIPAPHTPEWKRGIPRDTGAGWDFEDVRDHYMAHLFEVDPVSLRSHDPDRYRRLSRVTTGRVMARVFDEWRSPEHPCGGALVWYLRDLRPGAGWGIVDSENHPKPVYYYLKRAWAPVRVSILDRGLDGLRFEIHNETGDPVQGTVSISVFDTSATAIASVALDVEVPPRQSNTWSVEGSLGHFIDPTWAYRFGPLRHRAISVSFSTEGSDLLEVFWPDPGIELSRVDLETDLVGEDPQGQVKASGLARDVRLDFPGYVASDNYFDLIPEQIRHFALRSSGTGSPPKGFVEAENAPDGLRVKHSE